MKFLESKEWFPLSPNLKDCTIQGGDFKDQDLHKFNFSNSILLGADFSYSYLRGADFSGANLTRAIFRQVDLSFVNFQNARLVHTVFVECNMKGADFRYADLEGCAYPMSCDAFVGVTHSPDNLGSFLALIPLLRRIDPKLVEAIGPWVKEGVPLPTEDEKKPYY